MFIPIPIMIPLFRHQPSVKTDGEIKLEKATLEFQAKQAFKEFEQSVWRSIDYSKVYYFVSDNGIRKCYIPKRKLQPLDAVCFADEGHLSYVKTQNIKTTKQEAEIVLQNYHDWHNNPKSKYKIENWRGGYRIVDEKGNLVRDIL